MKPKNSKTITEKQTQEQSQAITDYIQGNLTEETDGEFKQGKSQRYSNYIYLNWTKLPITSFSGKYMLQEIVSILQFKSRTMKSGANKKTKKESKQEKKVTHVQSVIS